MIRHLVLSALAFVAVVPVAHAFKDQDFKVRAGSHHVRLVHVPAAGDFLGLKGLHAS